ncbi:peptidylprolyl isomerase [Thioclava sp. BHET1]|nr:peptidylprolyl isomerase [Thioclava sp. BHET1]
MPKLTKLSLGTALALVLAGPALADSATTTAPADKAADTAKTADASTAPAPTADTVVATVNGTKITLGNVIALRDQLPPQYAQLPGPVLFKGIVQQLIQQTLLQQSVEGKLTQKDQLSFENSKRAFLAGVALDKVTQDATSDAALQAAYDKQYSDAKPGTEYHAAHILVKTKAEADKIEAELKKGADFATLAKKDSTDKGSATQGGDLGWFGEGMMVEPFQKAVEALKPGEVSAPVQTQFGWHVIKLEGTRPAKKPTLDDVKDELSKQLEQQAVEAKVAELTKGAKIEDDSKGIDPKVLDDKNLLKN